GPGAAGRRHRARRRGAGLDLRLGSLRRPVRPRHRHEDIWRIGPAQGAAAKIRVRAAACDGDREATPRQRQEELKGYPEHFGRSENSSRRGKAVKHRERRAKYLTSSFCLRLTQRSSTTISCRITFKDT